MSFLNNPGRRTGLLYLLSSVPVFFGIIYVPTKLLVRGDATATAHNIAASETLFRLGILGELAGQALFVGVALALYHLLKDVDRRQALLMLVLILVSIPIAFLNEVNSIAAVTLIHGASFLSVFDEPQRFVLARFFLNLRGAGFEIAGIFWGLWLFPLGLLVYRSRFIPRFIGVLLMVCCFSYLADSTAALAFPQYQAAVSRVTSLIRPFELIFILWLIIMGAKPKPLPD